MAETVHQGVGLQGIGEKPHPFLNGPITGQDERSLQVAFVDDLIEVVGLVLGEGFQAEVVDDQTVIAQITPE